MARVEIASMPWGVLLDRHGESQNGTTATLKNLDGSNATTWSAVTGGSSSTSSLTADSNGNLPRFVEGGQYTLDVPALGVSGRRVEAVSGSVESGTVLKARVALNAKNYGAIGDGAAHPLSEGYASLAAAQAVYPFVTSGNWSTLPVDLAAIQHTHNLVGAAGGGVVDIPEGTYVLSQQYDEGAPWCLGQYHDYVVIKGRGEGTVLSNTADNARVLAGWGHLRLGSDWQTNWMKAVGRTVYGFTADIAKFAMSVFVSPANAANFAVGDAVYLRSGATLAQGSTFQPDSEFNQIASVNLGTGELGLAWPTGKPYKQEYYQGGAPNGPTTLAVTATLAPFGIVNVEDIMMRGSGLSDLRIHRKRGTLPTTFMASISTCFDYFVERVKFTGDGAPLSDGDSRFSRWRSLVMDIDDTNNGYSGFATGSGDAEVDGVKMRSKIGQSRLECHEGTFRIKTKDVEFQNPITVPALQTSLDIRSRAYDHLHVRPRIVNAGTSAPITITTAGPHVDDVGGRIVEPEILGNVGAGNCIGSDYYGWEIVNPKQPRTKSSMINLALRTSRKPARAEFYSTQMTFADSTIIFGDFPTAYYIVFLEVQVIVAFNGISFNTLRLGSTGAAQELHAGLSITATGIQAPTKLLGYRTAGTDLLATYVNGGSPTTGQLVLVVGVVPVAART